MTDGFREDSEDLGSTIEAVVHGRAHDGPMRRPLCRCGAIGVRHETYDAYACPDSGVWLEEVCSDDDFHFCKKRPATMRMP